MKARSDMNGTGGDRQTLDASAASMRLPVTNLTLAAQQGVLSGGAFSLELLEELSRGLYRSTRNLLVVGDAGIGKTTLLQELARQSALGQHPHLTKRQFLLLHCREIPATDGPALLNALRQSIPQAPQQVWCLDDFGSFFQEQNRPLLAALSGLLSQARQGVVIVLSRQEYATLLSQDAALLQRFTKVELEEPDEAAALEIAKLKTRSLEEQFQVMIPLDVVERTVALTSNFLLSERHPAKSIRLLERVCEDLDFNRTQLHAPVDQMQISEVIAALAARTGIPAETIAGETVTVDFAQALGDAVVGQEAAIEQVTQELRLIKAGLNEPGKPASVLLFAGMTGVGKTELAKRIAEIYSSSRRLQTYTMANFTEPHSVSGIIGVPPGYVGFDQGGRLINELNADPYSVFLLDEAEKAHPNVWKPFLNLFDEGWIVDQRGVKAYADRAIFILTTNAGDRNIAQMTRNGKSPEEIAEHVKQALSKVRHERSSQPVFPPAFLARIGRIVVFHPLDEAAMIGIAQRTCQRLQRQWERKGHRQFHFVPDLIESLGRRGHELNERSGGREGGRVIRKLVLDELEIQAASEGQMVTEAKAAHSKSIFNQELQVNL